MGWKSFSIFVQPPGSPSFGDMSALYDQGADALCDTLFPGLYTRTDTSTLESAIYPKSGDLHLANFGRSAVICEQDIACAFFAGKKHLWRTRTSPEAAAARDKILAHFSDREIIVLVMNSVVNLWGYAVYQDGALVRCAAGAADDGIICDTGPPLPEEQATLGHQSLSEIDEEGGGEDLVFEISRKLFGMRLDQVELKNVALVRYILNASGPRAWFQRLIRR